ncbi:MAG: indolepyruvate ferredoxin oxidoreductase subunit alpha [Methanobacterium sp.]|jgi:indolepyruvate ferredoxin oxidoreductase alpha subunit
MNIKEVLTAQENEELFLLGNEAAVRGALEAGVSVASTYPGTPSSEIGDVFSKIAKDAEIYFEFSTNEKVALEVAAAAAVSGLRSFTFMKHVGLNVASDSLMTTAYSGVNGGMIVLSADDPSMFSSQNEQDNRHYAPFASIPLLEPSNPQEIKDVMNYGFKLSEEFQIPILIRTTTRVSHMRGVVKMDTIYKGKNVGFFYKDSKRFVPVPEAARRMHKKLMDKMKGLQERADESTLNQIFHKKGSLGIITSGGAFNYVMDVVNENDLPVNVLKLTFTYPFPEETVLKFMKDVEEVLVVEEVDPVMENGLLAVLGKNGVKKEIHGKLDGYLPLIYEYNPGIVLNGIRKVLNGKAVENKIQEISIQLPNRPPTLCPGCPHRAVYYSVNKVISDLNLDNVIFPTDIGCYTLGIESPYNAGDYLLSMGSSIGTSCGFSKATEQCIVSFIGDSTFFHAGIPPLINAVHNKDRFVLVILDNRTTAMTGGQPHPGLPVDGMGEVAPEISIEKIVEAMDVKFIRNINPLNLKESQLVLREALEYHGVAVIISKYPCMLIKSKRKMKNLVVEVKDNCINCTTCLDDLSCPAIYDENDSIRIDPKLCRGCGVCIQLCPEKAIKVKRNLI